MINKSLVNGGRTFGIELEMVNILPKNIMANILCDNGLATYIWDDHSHWKLPQGYDFGVKRDGSINPHNSDFAWHTCEFITRPMNYCDNDLHKLEQALKVISRIGGEVNKSTGFHIHWGFQSKELTMPFLRSLYNLCYRYENIIYGLVAPSRKRNHYCSPLPSKTRVRDVDNYRDFMGQAGGDRYGCNFSALVKSRDRLTLEFRYHQGTLDFKKVSAWILFTQRLIEHSKNRFCGSKNRLPNDKKNLYNLLYTIGMKENSKIYLEVEKPIRDAGIVLVNNWKKFNEEAEKEAKPLTARPDNMEAIRQQLSGTIPIQAQPSSQVWTIGNNGGSVVIPAPTTQARPIAYPYDIRLLRELYGETGTET